MTDATRRKSVLLIGLRADVVDYSKWPDLTREKLEAGFTQVVSELEAAGFDAEWCLTDRGETAETQVAEMLDANAPDVVLVGAGVRVDPDQFALFETLINVIHRGVPDTTIAFNTNPFDSAEAVRRAVSRGIRKPEA